MNCDNASYQLASIFELDHSMYSIAVSPFNPLVGNKGYSLGSLVVVWMSVFGLLRVAMPRL
jgi:hypothetical protein